MEALMPKLEKNEHVPAVTPAEGAKALTRSAFLLGCVQREFFPQVNAATARVLAAEGCEVSFRHNTPAPAARANGACRRRPEGAFWRSPEKPSTFARANVDTIVTNAAGCGSNVKEYGHPAERRSDTMSIAPKPSPAKCKVTSPKFSPTLRAVAPQEIPCRSALRSTAPATCSTPKGCALNPANCSPAYPASGKLTEITRKRHLLRLPQASTI